MSDINALVEEGLLGHMGAIASGIGGAATGGRAVAHFQSHKAEAARKAIGRINGEKDTDYKQDRTGTHMIARTLGSIPIVGAVSNGIMYAKHHNTKDRLEELKNKAKKG